jgi:MSHA pilin protein MshD
MCATRLRRGRGVTLIELVVFIVIVGVAMAGLFAAFNTITAASADPQVRKQVLAIAESLMEEIQLMPFTICDPDDPAASTATVSTDCGTAAEALGPETISAVTETRYSTTAPFDNVNDYNGFSMTPGTGGIKDITGTPVTGLENYTATVTVSLAGTALGLAADEQALKIVVAVSHPNGTSITLEGYRTRYAPKTGL